MFNVVTHWSSLVVSSLETHAISVAMVYRGTLVISGSIIANDALKGRGAV
jgi:hypothetical protein